MTIASFAEPTSSNEAPFWKIANKMWSDDIGQIVKTDRVVRVHIINKSNSKISDQSKHVSQKLRDLARLVKEAGRHSCFKSTYDLLDPSKYSSTVKAALAVARFNVETNESDSPSYAQYARILELVA